MRGLEITISASLLLAWMLAGCAAPVSPDYDRRTAVAKRGLDADPAVAARAEEVQAAIARERGEAVLDSMQLRVENDWDQDYRLGLTTRIPVPNPLEIRARRETRRTDTEVALARLEETALGRSAELCFASMERAAHRGRTQLYADYASRQYRLLEWNEEWRRSGSQSERSATEIELESRVRLARRSPGPPPPPLEAATADLPPLAEPSGRVVRTHELVRETLRAHNPSVAVQEAVAEHYRALSDRAKRQRWPWLDFVDFSYEPVSRRNDNEIGTQIAVGIPFGARPRADVERYRALSRSHERQQATVVEDQMRATLLVLDHLDHFEAGTAQWQELLQLADKAEAVTEERWRGRLAQPSQVAGLLEQAYDARITVLEAREAARVAGCTLLALTGVSPESWPRE